MSSRNIKILIMVGALSGLLIVTGCESDAQTGALIGTAAGAGIGQLAGGHTEQDKKKAEAEMMDLRHEMNSVTVHVTNSNGSIIAVRLQRSGPGYIGPRGEYYPTLPSEDQLRPVYGF
jgi:hypothetical protein